MSQQDKIPVSRFPNIPGKTADPDQTWAYLSNAVDYIMTDPKPDLSFADYANITAAVFHYCGADKVPRTAGPHRSPSGPSLYQRLSDHLVPYFQALNEKSGTLQDVDLLRFYADEWNRYATSAKHLDRLFAYVNRHWVKRERDEGRKHVHQVGTLVRIHWKMCYFSPLQQDNAQVTSAVLRLINQQRDGESIDQSLVKTVVDSFVSLGLDDSDPNKECLDVYQEQFETALLEATEKYYEAKSEALLAQNSVPDYLKEVEERLREEEAHVEQYLHASTREVLITKCEHTLIRAHSGLMGECLPSLLDSENDEDLQRIYALLSRIPEGLDPLRQRFEAHVKQAGLTGISKLVDEGGANADSIDPKAYADALLEVYRKSSETVRRNFKGDVGFVASLDNAFRELVHRNVVTGTSSITSSELIAKHAGALHNKEREGALENMRILMGYLEEKGTSH